MTLSSTYQNIFLKIFKRKKYLEDASRPIIKTFEIIMRNFRGLFKTLLNIYDGIWENSYWFLIVYYFRRKTAS